MSGGVSSVTSGVGGQYSPKRRVKSPKASQTHPTESVSVLGTLASYLPSISIFTSCQTVTPAAQTTTIPKKISKSNPEKDKINLVGEKHNEKNHALEKDYWNGQGFDYFTEEDIEKVIPEAEALRVLHVQIMIIHAVNDVCRELQKYLQEKKDRIATQNQMFTLCQTGFERLGVLDPGNIYFTFFLVFLSKLCDFKPSEADSSKKIPSLLKTNLQLDQAFLDHLMTEFLNPLECQYKRDNSCIEKYSDWRTAFDVVCEERSKKILAYAAQHKDRKNEIWVLGNLHVRDMQNLDKPTHIKLIDYGDYKKKYSKKEYPRFLILP